MNPCSEQRLALDSALVDGPGTSRQLALRTGCSLVMVQMTLHNMWLAGHVVKLPQRARVPGCKRPVPVYARAVVPVDEADAGQAAMVSLIAAWAGLPGRAQPVALEVAM